MEDGMGSLNGLTIRAPNGAKNGGKNQKNLLGVFVQVKIGLKKILSQKEFFLENSLFAQTPPSSKKMGF